MKKFENTYNNIIEENSRYEIMESNLKAYNKRIDNFKEEFDKYKEGCSTIKRKGKLRESKECKNS